MEPALLRDESMWEMPFLDTRSSLRVPAIFSSRRHSVKKPFSYSVEYADLERPMREDHDSSTALPASSSVESHQVSRLVCEDAHLVMLTTMDFRIKAEKVGSVWS